MTREELFFKKGFEVCLLNKVFAVIITLHIKVQNHLMLEVTENCYHLMALWGELSQTTLHALRDKDPVPGHCPGETSRIWATLRLQPSHSGITGLKSDCHSAMALICRSHPIWRGLSAILISLGFSLLISRPLIYLWDQRSQDEL